MFALTVDAGIRGTGGRYVAQWGPSAYADAGYCGRSFAEGLLRFHDSETGPRYRRLVHAAFPELEGLADVLAFDWHGCQLVTRADSGYLWLADPSTGTLDEFTTPEEFSHLLRTDAVISALNGGLFDRWRAYVDSEGARVPWDAAIAYRVPLFAGGEEHVEELQLTDLEGLWETAAQQLDELRRPPGALPSSAIPG